MSYCWNIGTLRTYPGGSNLPYHTCSLQQLVSNHEVCPGVMCSLGTINVYFVNLGMNFLWGLDIFWIWWNPFHWQYVTNKCHTGLKGKGFLWFDFKVKYKLNPIQHLWTQRYHLSRKLRWNIVDYQGTSPLYDNRTLLHYELAEHRSQLKQPSGPSAECCFRDVNFFHNLLEVALGKVKAGEPYGSLHYLDFLTLSTGNESHTEILLSFQKSMIKQIIQITFVYLLFFSPAPS